METLIFRIASNYGQEAIYPTCDTAKTIVNRLLGKKTIARSEIKILVELGYVVATREAGL